MKHRRKYLPAWQPRSIRQGIVRRHEVVKLRYLTTLAYPTVVVAMVLFMFAYWVIKPVWQEIAAGHRKKSYLGVLP